MTHVLVRHVGFPTFMRSQVLHTSPFGSMLLPLRRNLLPPVINGLSRAPTSGTLLPMQASLACHTRSSWPLLTQNCGRELIQKLIYSLALHSPAPGRPL